MENTKLDEPIVSTHTYPILNDMNGFSVFVRVESRKIMVRTIKERAQRVLELVQKCAGASPEVRFQLVES